MKQYIYLLEDDEVSGSLLKAQLKDKGFKCCWFSNSTQLLEKLAKCALPDIFILDQVLIGDTLSGLDVCRRIKHSYRKPVVMLTGDRRTKSVLGCMAVGADLYIEKPYDIEQLLAKISAIVRLYDQLEKTGLERSNVDPVLGVMINPFNRTLSTENSMKVTLTEKEMAFFEILCGRKDFLVSRDEAFMGIYGRAMEPMSRAIDNLACRVRAKLKTLEADVELQVIRGVGYKLVDSAARRTTS